MSRQTVQMMLKNDAEYEYKYAIRIVFARGGTSKM